MDILGAMFMELFANTRGCKYQDTEWRTVSGEDMLLNGRTIHLRANRPHRPLGKPTSTSESGRVDRTAWGSYTESAPPVLPENTCVPGFEDEVLLAIRRQEREIHDEESDADDSDKDYSNLHIDDRRRKSARKERGHGLDDTPTRHARDRIHLLTLGLLPTILSYHTSFPFSLTTSLTAFGSERTLSTGQRKFRMAPKTHLWISLWFLLTAPVIMWDAGYCFMRPRSFKGGDLHWIWEPYSIYQEVDYVYGVEAYNRGDGFASAQSFMNVVETLLNLYYLYAQHVLSSPAAPLIGFASAVMTLSKTVLYWAQEYFCGGCAIGHNDWNTLLWYWIIPNGLWLIIPTLIIHRLTCDITAGLKMASKVAEAKKD